MKRWYSVFLISVVLISFFASCKKFLDVESFDAISDEKTIFDKASAETAVRGAYSAVSLSSYGSSFQTTILLAGSDIKSLNNAQTDLNIINHDLRSDIAFLSTYWLNFYNAINISNHIIEKVPLVNDVALTDEIRDQFLGEAYFIRALSYFDLARVFGNVPIYLTPTLTIEDKLGVPQSNQATVYNQAITDLNQAIELLPASVVRNRARKSTAYALRARVNLYLKKYQEAENDATEVINNTSYQLIKPFKLAGGTAESILELSYNDNNTNPAFGLWNTSNRALEPKSEIHSLLNDKNIGGGRKILSVQSSLGIVGAICPTKTSPAYLIRTAEVYLIRAEARASRQTPDLTGALADLNAVRERSEVPLATVKDKEGLLLAIENERRIEFALEPHRWFDLTRTGRAAAVLGATNPQKYIFPIPESEILADPSLVQNPSYN
ncbi:hypothetical protein A8C56_10960 [Niabella ginsenosidivorans]|uniref:RagB/SusD family nutrient uptake outer membrane protein n=1 Tax=Niabella ginsenosidivorans TaxID=1176587 RepID=A0A1A9I423_9BACT|nr:RagB/SusD family nutrient uptake outer membrane protein [Niabella ginsenosidivorans]ANH81431.1 hypothetical protein A8C56_10960 [Niabella ginsenosidivorans]